MDPYYLEVAALVGTAGALVIARHYGHRHLDTISGLFWTIRDSLDRRHRWVLAASLAAALGWVWVHFLYGG